MSDRGIYIGDHGPIPKPISLVARFSAWFEGYSMKVDFNEDSAQMVIVVAVVFTLGGVLAVAFICHTRNNEIFAKNGYCEYAWPGYSSTAWIKCDTIMSIRDATWNGLKEAQQENFRAYNGMRAREAELKLYELQHPAAVPVPAGKPPAEKPAEKPPEKR